MIKTTLISPKIIESIKNLESSAVKERLPVALTALACIPAIDYFNPEVDKDTRKYSAIKSVIKIAIGTVNGLFARAVGQKLGEKLVEKGIVKPLSQGIANNPETVKAFTKSVGKTAAFVATMASIIAMDIPFINKMLNFTMKKLFPNMMNKGE